MKLNKTLLGLLCALTPISALSQSTLPDVVQDNITHLGTLVRTLNIAPPTNTLTQGLNIVQTGPTSGTTPGPQNYNLISVTDIGPLLSATAGLVDSFNLLQAVSSAFRVNDVVGPESGGGHAPIHIAGTFALRYDGVGANDETVGVIGSSFSNTSPGALWGTIGNASAGPAATISALIPVAAEVSAAPGSTILRKVGFLAIDEAAVHGSALDAAIAVASQAMGGAFGSPTGFKSVITVSNNWFPGTPALDPTANFFMADSATSITNWAKMDNVTVVGDIMLFPNLDIPGAGPGFVLPPHTTAAFQYGNTAAIVPMEVSAFTGIPMFVGKRANTSSTAPSTILLNETYSGLSGQGYDGTTYAEGGGIGIRAAQNWTNVAHGTFMSFFTTPLGSITETEAARFGASGSLLVGTTTDPGAAGIVNVATGYRVNNVALASTNLSDTIAATTWTTTDQSGAGLAFTTVTGNYSKSNKTCVGTTKFTFPATADATVAKIALPTGCTVANNGSPAIGSCFTTTAAATNAHQIMLGLANTLTAQFVNGAGGTTQPTNANLTGATVSCSFNFISQT